MASKKKKIGNKIGGGEEGSVVKAIKSKKQLPGTSKRKNPSEGCQDIRRWAHSKSVLEDPIVTNKGTEVNSEDELEATMEDFDRINKLVSLSKFGFDNENESLTYPTSQQTYEFERTIVDTALFNNTMVRLPKGIDQGFICSVILRNFHRWYPSKLIVSLAPNIAEMDSQFTACMELFGSNLVGRLLEEESTETRVSTWKTKKIMFTTPSVFLEDLNENRFFKAKYVRCLIFTDVLNVDEYSNYEAIVQRVILSSQLFRIVGLTSALIPIDLYRNILPNLLISQIKMYYINSIDFIPYARNCTRDIVNVELDGYAKDTLMTLNNSIKTILDRLVENGEDFGDTVIHTAQSLQSCLRSYKNYRDFNTAISKGKLIEKDYCVAIALLSAIEVLRSHGVLTFYRHLKRVCHSASSDKRILKVLTEDSQLHQLILSIEKDFWVGGLNSLFVPSDKWKNNSFLYPDYFGGPVNYIGDCISHPKLEVLKSLIKDHFASSSDRISRAVVLSQYATSCDEIWEHLNTLQPNIISKVISLEIMDKDLNDEMEREADLVQFETGEINVLICQFPGIQHLDLAELDLIVCFDANVSPCVLFERMQLPTRKSDGKIIFMTSWNEELRILNANKERESSLAPVNTTMIEKFCCRTSPRMVPYGMYVNCASVVTYPSQETANSDNNLTTNNVIQQKKMSPTATVTSSQAVQMEERSEIFKIPSFGVSVKRAKDDRQKTMQQGKMVENRMQPRDELVFSSNADSTMNQRSTSYNFEVIDITESPETGEKMIKNQKQETTGNHEGPEKQKEENFDEKVTEKNQKKSQDYSHEKSESQEKQKEENADEIVTEKNQKKSQDYSHEKSESQEKQKEDIEEYMARLEKAYNDLFAPGSVCTSLSQHHYEPLFAYRKEKAAVLKNSFGLEEPNKENSDNDQAKISIGESKLAGNSKPDQKTQPRELLEKRDLDSVDVDEDIVHIAKKNKRCGRVIQSQATYFSQYDAPPPVNLKKQQRPLPRRNPFILDQAELSGEENSSMRSEEGDEEEEALNSGSSFVETNDIEETESQYLMHLQGLCDDSIFDKK